MCFFLSFFPPPPFRLIVQDFQVYFFPHTVSFRIPLFCTGTTPRKHIKCAFDIGWLSSSSNKAKQQRKKKKQNGSEKPAQLCWSQWIAFETANATPKKMEVKYRTLKWDKKQTKQNKPKKKHKKHTPLNVKFLLDIQIWLLSLCRRFSNQTLDNYLLTQSVKLSDYLPRRRNGWNEPQPYNPTPFTDTAGYSLMKSFTAVKKDNYAKSQFLYIYPQC